MQSFFAAEFDSGYSPCVSSQRLWICSYFPRDRGPRLLRSILGRFHEPLPAARVRCLHRLRSTGIRFLCLAHASVYAGLSKFTRFLREGELVPLGVHTWKSGHSQQFCSVSSPEEYRKLNLPRAVQLGSGHYFCAHLISGSRLLSVPVACGVQAHVFLLGAGFKKMSRILGSTLVLLMRQSWRLLMNFTSFPRECRRAVRTWTWT